MPPIRTLILHLAGAAALVGNLAKPTFAFHIAPIMKKPTCSTPKCPNLVARHIQNYHRPTNMLRVSESQEDHDQMPVSSIQEQIMQSPLPNPIRRPVDPLVASLTRIDEPPTNAPTVKAPLIGEVPADNNLSLLAFSAAFAVLGLLFSIFVAINSKDAFVQELSGIELPKVEYTPTVVNEGECRGLCSGNQEENLEGLRGFMESISGK